MKLRITKSECGAVTLSSERGAVADMTAGYGKTRQEDADHIVKCVNAHDELVAAAGELLAFCKLAHHDRTVMTRLESILAKLEGESK